MSKKAVVIVPGFWGDPASFNKVVDELSASGYYALVVKLPSWGCEPPTKTLLDDAEAVRSEVSRLVDAGQEVTVAMHSAGGFIAPEGIKGLLAPNLANSGKLGGVTSLVFIAAPCMSTGDEAPPAPWYEYKGDYLWVKDPKKTLYSDLPDEEVEAWTKRLKHHPAYDYNTKTTHEPWNSVPSVYLKTANDAVIPVELQTVFANKIPGCSVHTCDSGHSPFLSCPSEVVMAIIEAAEKPTWSQ